MDPRGKVLVSWVQRQINTEKLTGKSPKSTSANTVNVPEDVYQKLPRDSAQSLFPFKTLGNMQKTFLAGSEQLSLTTGASFVCLQIKPTGRHCLRTRSSTGAKLETRASMGEGEHEPYTQLPSFNFFFK